MLEAIKAVADGKTILLWAIGATVAVIVAFSAGQALRRQDAIAAAEDRMQAKTTLLAEHMTRTFEMADLALRALRRLRGDALSKPFDSRRAHRELSSLHAQSPVFISLAWTDAAGDRVATSLSPNPSPLNLAYREHFQVPRRGREYAEKPFVGAPAFADDLDSWVLAVALRLEDADGAFLGVAAGALDLAYVGSVFAQAELGPSGIVRLVRNDGVLLTQYPYDVADLGRKVRLPEADDRNSSRRAAQDDDGGRMIAKAPVAGGDVYVVASQSIDAALEPYWSQFWEDAVFVATLLAALLSAAFLLSRSVRRRAALEAAARVRADRVRAYAGTTSDWFWELDADRRFVWVSESVKETLGYGPEWFLGKRPEEVVGADAAGDYEAHWRTQRAHAPFSGFEYAGVGKQRDRCILASGVPNFDDDGKFLGYFGSAKDITALRRAERRLEDVIRSFPGAVMVFDRNEQLALHNQNAEIFGRTDDAHLQTGETFEQISRDLATTGRIDDAKDDPEAWIAARLATFRSDDGYTLLHIDGKVIEAVERPLADGGTISLGIDVTERERNAALLAEARDIAEKANRAKSDFLANMSHEFRTPLNAIIGFSQLLQFDEPGSLTDLQMDYIDSVEKSGQYLLNLVSDVLDLADIEAGALQLSIEPVETAWVLSQAVATMQPVAASSDIRLTLDMESGLATTQADTQRLRQILLNLLSNAIKYNRPNGFVRVTARAAGENVRITVEDNGIGIAPEHSDQVFAPFTRLGVEKSVIEGAGVGLSLCRRLVDAMKGTIGFESVKGEGTTFWIEVPMAEPADKPALANLPAESSEADAFSLLYVDDNPTNLRLMRSLVSTLPKVTMSSAPSGPIGLDLARVNRPDIIVLDLNLPGMNGLDILKGLQSSPETRATPVIALTAAARPVDIEHGLTAGFFRYLTKPLDVNAFLAAIEAALEGQPSLADKPKSTQRHSDNAG